MVVGLRAADIERRHTWVLGNGTALDRRPGHEQARGRPVVRSLAAVFMDATAEFRKRHGKYTLVMARFLKTREEEVHRIRQFGQQPLLIFGLPGVRVESIDHDV